MNTSHFSINCFVNRYCFIKTTQLKDFVDKPYHLYFILTQPKSYFIIGSFVQSNKTFSCDIKKNSVIVSLKGVIIPEFEEGIITGIKYTFSNDHSTLALSYYKNFVKKQKIVISANDAYELSGKCLAMERRVLYIGQSQGRTNNRVAGSRLISHSTLNKIQSDILSNGSDEEISLLLCDFLLEPILSLFPGVDTEIIRKKFNDFWENRKKMSHKLCIDVAEAGLINYFKPQYNHVYVNSLYNKNKKSKFKDLYFYGIDKIQIQFVPDKERPIGRIGTTFIFYPDVVLYTDISKYDTSINNCIIECNLNNKGVLSTKLVQYDI